MLGRGGQHHYLRRVLLFGIALAVYIVLSSTIYNATQEIKMTDYLIESTLYFINIRDNKFGQVVLRERELTKDIDYEKAESLKGKILLQVELNGEAWYVDPLDLKRYYLGKPREMMILIKKKSKALSSEELFDYRHFEKVFPKELAGRFVKNQDSNEEYYYVLPEKLTSIKIGSPNEAFRLLKDQGLGISNKEIRQIEVAE
jgi:hypothetical protein